MIKQLEEQFAAAVSSQELIAGMTDVTKHLQISFNSADCNIVRALLQADSERPVLVLVIGFRSEMLMPFTQTHFRAVGEYLPCDIPGIVPGLAAVINHQGKGITANAVVRGDVTRLVLVFEGKASHRESPMTSLVTGLYRFFKSWMDWSSVLLSIINNDPVIGEWSLDWREFLAGESGLMTMPWFSPLTYTERSIALERIVLASKALLSSVLSEEQADDPMIRYLDRWMTYLRPLSQLSYDMDESEGARA
ncbi:MAG: hypothetical protein ACTSYL_08810 [Candidatus Thorarchaeota archaeon]